MSSDINLNLLSNSDENNKLINNNISIQNIDAYIENKNVDDINTDIIDNTSHLFPISNDDIISIEKYDEENKNDPFKSNIEDENEKLNMTITSQPNSQVINNSMNTNIQIEDNSKQSKGGNQEQEKKTDIGDNLKRYKCKPNIKKLVYLKL